MLNPTIIRRLLAGLIGTSSVLAVAVPATTAQASAEASGSPLAGLVDLLPENDALPLRSADESPPLRIASAPLIDVCPVDGESTFEDSFGWARSGGRSHQGVDLVATRGTPVVAVRDGEAQFKTNGLGGRAVWLTAANGDRFYYAHLDDWNGESRSVRAGELIGWVGSTGNARGPHLHFETLRGGVVENPYPATHHLCVALPKALADAERRANAIPAGALSDPAVWARFVPDQA